MQFTLTLYSTTMTWNSEIFSSSRDHKQNVPKWITVKITSKSSFLPNTPITAQILLSLSVSLSKKTKQKKQHRQQNCTKLSFVIYNALVPWMTSKPEPRYQRPTNNRISPINTTCNNGHQKTARITNAVPKYHESITAYRHTSSHRFPCGGLEPSLYCASTNLPFS